MIRERTPLVVGTAVLMMLAALGGWALGRTSNGANEAAATTEQAPIKTVHGVEVGVLHNQAGALAASDNYVATSSETVVQDPVRYSNLVRQAYVAGYQPIALRDGVTARKSAPASAALYASGGKSLAIVAARRLESYSTTRAATTTWLAGVTWGPGRVPGHTWSLVHTTLMWTDHRWRVASLDPASSPAPAPSRLGYSSRAQLATSTFDRELRGMTAPIYGGG